MFSCAKVQDSEPDKVKFATAGFLPSFDRRLHLICSQIGWRVFTEKYKSNNKTIQRHSFIVIEDKNGTIEGLPYDFIGNVLSSFKSDEQKTRKLNYPGNFPISHDDTITDPHNDKNGYVKADQLYYFKKDKIEYKVIGNIIPDILDMIFEYIETSDFEIVNIIDNL